jgi:hypothetical protein
VICLTPLIFLFVPNANVINPDWINHFWQIAYYGRNFHSVREFPTILNTMSQIGMVHPVFYGYLFYPIFGFVASFLGASFAVRALLGLLWALTYFLVFMAADRASRSRWRALVISLIVCFATYPLTNLYSRAALTEFFATECLTGAVAAWLIFLWEDNGIKRIPYLVVSGLMITLSLGSHPITGLFGGLCFLIIFLGSVPSLWKRGDFTSGKSLALFAAVAIASGTIIFPWAYAVKIFSSQLIISHMELLYFSFYDSLRSRFSFLPTDLGGVSQDPELTPFLESQLNMALFVFLLISMALAVVRGQLASRRREILSLLVLSLVGFLFITLVSIFPRDLPYPGFQSVMSILRRGIFRYAQFAYRFVTYSNLFLFTATLSCLRWDRRETSSRKASLLWAGIPLVLALMSLGVKLQHSLQTLCFDDFRTYVANIPTRIQSALGDLEIDPSTLPPTFYGLPDYAVGTGPTQIFPEIPSDTLLSLQAILLHVERDGAAFSSISPKKVSIDKPEWMVINVFPFPWNKILIDGTEVSPENQGLVFVPTTVNYRLDRVPNVKLGRNFLARAIKMPVGLHTVDYLYAPDLIWVTARRISMALVGLWIASLIAWSMMHLYFVMRLLRADALTMYPKKILDS